MNFQGHLENVYRMIKNYPLVLILGGFVVALLNVCTLGIISGPLLGGFFLMILGYMRAGGEPQFNDIFSGLKRFGDLFPFFFLSLLILFGFILLIIPGLIFMTWWIYALLLMADKGHPLGEAMRLSKAKVGEKGFFLHLVFLFLISVVPTMLISFLGAIIPLLEILHILVFPLQCGCLASLYLEQFEGLDPGELGRRQLAEPVS